MKKNILNYLQDNISKLSKSQKLVADYIIKNPMEATYSTIDTMAQRVGVSTTTIVRLSIALGYSGYAEFQRELQSLLRKQSDPTIKLEMNLKIDEVKDNLIQEIVNQQTLNLNSTLDGLTDEKIIKAEELITKGKNIYVLGGRSCFSVAHYIYYNLNRIYGNCTLLSDEGGTLPEKLRKINKEDVLITLTLPRYIKSIISSTEIAKEKGVSIIGITDGYMSPLANYADVLFIANCKSIGFHNETTSLMLIADILISLCTMNNIEKVKANLEELKKISDKLTTHIN